MQCYVGGTHDIAVCWSPFIEEESEITSYRLALFERHGSINTILMEEDITDYLTGFFVIKGNTLEAGTAHMKP